MSRFLPLCRFRERRVIARSITEKAGTRRRPRCWREGSQRLLLVHRLRELVTPADDEDLADPAGLLYSAVGTRRSIMYFGGGTRI